jgi:hypothetical protein
MNVFLIAALLGLVPVVAALVFVFRALSSQSGGEAPGDGNLVLAPGKYRPMERLLRADDFRFLAAQPGYSPKLGNRFRSQRRQIFRAYLKNLKRDFTRVSLTFQTLIVHSAEDRGDLAAGLVRQRTMFAFAMLAVEGRLLLHAAGMNSVTVDVSGVVESLETMQDQMRALLAPPQGAMAAI